MGRKVEWSPSKTRELPNKLNQKLNYEMVKLFRFVYHCIMEQNLAKPAHFSLEDMSQKRKR